MSVGKPGKGEVSISTALGLEPGSISSDMVAPSQVIPAPASDSFSMTASNSAGLVFFSLMLPPVMAAATR